jgi:hypothetical protein
MAVEPFDYFTYGRKQAGMGWYQPAPPGWLTIGSGVLQGLAKGVQQGATAYAGRRLENGAGTPATLDTPAVTGVTDLPPGTTTGRTESLSDILNSRPPAGPSPDPMGEVPGAPTAPYSPTFQPIMLDPYRTPGQPALTPEQRKRLMMIYAFSSRELKDNIERADERRSLAEIMRTPVYRYRYHDEAPGTQGRIGPMADEVPSRWQVKDPQSDLTMIKMPTMIGAMMASIRALGRDVQTLQERLRG